LRVHAIFGIDNFILNLSEAVWSFTEDFHPNHLKGSIQNVLLPLVIDCPEAQLRQVVVPLLPSILHKLHARLNGIKHLMTSSSGETDMDDITDEILLDRLTRSAFQVYADFWGTVFTLFHEPKSKAQSPTAPKARPIFKYQSLVSSLFETNASVAAFLEALELLLTVDDTRCCFKGLQVAQNLIPYLLRNPLLHGFLGTQFTICILRVLNSGSQTPNHNAALGLIADIYYGLRSGGSQVPVSTFASLPGVDASALNVHGSDIDVRCSNNVFQVTQGKDYMRAKLSQGNNGC
jgi:hypothetical protein